MLFYQLCYSILYVNGHIPPRKPMMREIEKYSKELSILLITILSVSILEVQNAGR
jgi:hypothetical protein